MIKSRPPFLIAISFLFFSSSIFSQQIFKTDGFSITPKIGVGSMVGELGEISTINPNVGFCLEKGISEKFNLSIEIIGGNLSGKEDKIYKAKFQTDFFQIQTLMYLNISRFSKNYIKKDFEIKAYTGAGWIWFHTDVFDLKTGNFLRTTADGTTQHTQLFQQAGAGVGEKGIFYTRELIVPIGLFLDWQFGERIGLTANWGYNWVYNDKLDATNSYNLQNPNIIGGINSYSETANDSWINVSVGLKYRFKVNKFRQARGLAFHTKSL
jgi:hypothetical protein